MERGGGPKWSEWPKATDGQRPKTAMAEEDKKEEEEKVGDEEGRE
jgi:hypothetical protein